ncbi:hypothetical protein BJV77DRAFT_408720 [Russula vinacea]|nr:hypothetical protein BJV77DRAFT_408720 [Russula vinacea]
MSSTQKSNDNQKKPRRARGSNQPRQSQNTGSTMPQNQQYQNASVQPTGNQYQQQGQVHFGAGEQYGQPATSQPVQGTSYGANTPQMQSASAGQQSQYPRKVEFHPPITPGGQQGYSSTSSTTISGLEARTGAGGIQGQVHFAGGQYGLPTASQPVQGNCAGVNTLEIQSDSAGQQYQNPQRIKFRSPITPAGRQVDMGYGGTSSTSMSGLGAGDEGSMQVYRLDPFLVNRGGGRPKRGAVKLSRGRQG